MDADTPVPRFAAAPGRAPADLDPAPDPVAESIDGATGDWSVSGDAMRWSPALAERGPEPGLPLAGVDVAAGLGPVLGLEAAGVRRLVSGALSSLSGAASDVVSELRALTRGPSSDDR
jgi:hypothetical protein